MTRIPLLTPDEIREGLAPPKRRKRKGPDIWMPTVIGDYLGETGHLSAAEHGALHLMKIHYWRTGQPLPAESEPLRRIARMDRDEWAASEATLRVFFVQRAEALHRDEWEAERAHAEGNRQQASRAGVASAEAKKRKREALAKATPVATGVDTDVPAPVATDGPTAAQPDGQREAQRTVNSSPSPSEISFGNPSEARERGTDGPPSEPLAGEGLVDGQPFPKTWTLPGDWSAWATTELLATTGCGLPAALAWVPRCAAKFADYWRSTGAAKAGWEPAWRNWVRTEVDQGRGPLKLAAETPPPVPAEARASLREPSAAERADVLVPLFGESAANTYHRTVTDDAMGFHRWQLAEKRAGRLAKPSLVVPKGWHAGAIETEAKQAGGVA